MKSELIYLASPYSHPDPDTRLFRFESACRAAAALVRRGRLAFSPVAHSHPIATQGGLAVDWDFWQRLDCRMIDACDRVLVLTLDGWEESVGVRAEVEYARVTCKPVSYLSPLRLWLSDGAPPSKHTL